MHKWARCEPKPTPKPDQFNGSERIHTHRFGRGAQTLWEEGGGVRAHLQVHVRAVHTATRMQ